MEAIYQYKSKFEIPFSYSKKREIDLTDFNLRVSEGEQLVILDDMVLDVKSFLDDHPGGKFSLANNIGRDISKFFYGGYSLENTNKVGQHLHSNDAIKIVNHLQIGILVDEAKVRLMKVDSVDRRATKSGSIKTFKFTDVPEGDNYGKMVDGKCSINNISQIGRHYLLKSTSQNNKNGDGVSTTFNP